MPQSVADAPVFLYTDGACRLNREGGWAVIAVQDGEEIWRKSGRAANTTNNRMELAAILQGLAAANTKGFANVIVITDSRYCILMLTRETEFGQANHDMIKQTRSLLWAFNSCKFEWVKGHSGVEWNEAADKLAVAARGGNKAAHKRGLRVARNRLRKLNG